MTGADTTDERPHCTEPLKRADGEVEICQNPAVGRFRFNDFDWNMPISMPLCDDHQPDFEPEQYYADMGSTDDSQ